MPLRILVTGFSPFPGAPVNPSEELVRLFQQREPRFGEDIELDALLLKTSYAAVGETLASIGETQPPDIALHFGLARSAKGFRLERVARNVVSCASPDAVGYLPGDSTICVGAEAIESTLPLADIHRALTERNIPVEYSDSAGDYVCNFTFYSALGGLFGRFNPRMCGFIHIPYLGHQLRQVSDSEALPSLSEENLWQGALLIVETCIAAAKEARTTAPGAVR